MPGSILEALTRRRLGGAVLVLAGIAVALVVLWPSGAGDDTVDAKAVRLVSVPQLGLAFAHPRTWRARARRRVLRLRSPDGTAVMTFASPVAGRQTARVKAELKRALRRDLAPAKILREGSGRLGRRRVSTFELAGSGSNNRVRVLALVDSTPYRTYAITLLTPAHPSHRRLLEAQRILLTVRFTKPVRPKR